MEAGALSRELIFPPCHECQREECPWLQMPIHLLALRSFPGFPLVCCRRWRVTELFLLHQTRQMKNRTKQNNMQPNRHLDYIREAFVGVSPAAPVNLLFAMFVLLLLLSACIYLGY